jgi:DNA (cytosine-5)-methyltransferase 1
MRDPVKLCGSAFGLRVRRHRLFESNAALTGTECHHKRQGTPIGVYGAHPEVTFTPKRPVQGTSRGQRARTVGEARDAMGIPWMEWDDLADAIPPAYTQHLGAQLATAVRDDQGVTA